jgi:uncharacterized membrane protein
MYHVFERLDTSPGQEKAIRSALSELFGKLAELRPSVRTLRSEIARAMGSETFSPSEVQAAFEQRSGALGEAQGALTLALGKIHEALDPDQRKRLSQLLDGGPMAWCF